MIIGLIGLPHCGKTTLFNAICGTNRETGGFSKRGEVHRGRVKVPDPRLDALAALYHPPKVTPAEIEWMDVNFLSGDESDRQAMSAEIPPAIREASALAHVVRVFDNPDVEHVFGHVDPQKAIRHVEEDLVFSDFMSVEKRLKKLQRQVETKTNDQAMREYALLQKCLSHLEAQKPLRELSLSPDDEKLIRGFQFLSIKPKLIVLNIDETQIGRRDELLETFRPFGNAPQCGIDTVSARVQMELGELDEADRAVFMAELGIAESAFDRLMRVGYDLLGLISFLTAGETEVRAWTIRRGDTAQRAAGAIHEDLEKGFIRAEVISFEELTRAGSEAEAKKRGWIRLEGKQYTVRDGDVMVFRFTS